MKTKSLFMLAFASAMILTMPSQVWAEASEERSEVSSAKTLPYQGRKYYLYSKEGRSD